MKKWFVILAVLLLIICIGVLVFVGLDRRSPQDNTPLTAEQQKIADLIVQLGNDEWGKRFAATEELKQIGAPAQTLLAKAFYHRDDEIRPRSKSIARWILLPPATPETKTWTEFLVTQLGERGIKINFPEPQVANLQAPPPAPAAAEQPLPPPLPQAAAEQPLPPPLPNLGGGGMPNMGGGGRGGGMGGMGGMGGLGGMMPGLGGLGGLGMGGGRGGGGLGGIGQLMQQLQQLRARGGGGGIDPHNLTRTAPAPDVSNLSLDLTGGMGVRLTEAAEGLRVLDVRQGTPASRAGLRVGDLIKTADGKALTTLDDAKAAFGADAAGKTIKLELNRKGDALDLDVKL